MIDLTIIHFRISVRTFCPFQLPPPVLALSYFANPLPQYTHPIKRERNRTLYIKSMVIVIWLKVGHCHLPNPFKLTYVLEKKNCTPQTPNMQQPWCMIQLYNFSTYTQEIKGFDKSHRLVSVKYSYELKINDYDNWRNQ